MSEFVLSCSSVVDLTPEHLAKRNIHFVPFHYRLNGTDCIDDMGKSVSHDDFYLSMIEGGDAATSQVNVDEYLQYFGAFLAQGKDILHLELSSGLSGSSNSARIAAEMLTEQYPNNKLYVIDSLAASAGAGLLVETVADRRDAGATIDELYRWVEDNKLKMHHWFTASDLTWRSHHQSSRLVWNRSENLSCYER